MKKSPLTALPARLLTVNADAVALRVKMSAAYELDGGFYGALTSFAQTKVQGVKLTARTHGPRMSELYGIDGDLNTVGLHIMANRELTSTERLKIEKAIEFFLENVSAKRTLLAGSKNRMELRKRTIIHKTHGEFEMVGILKYVITF